MKHSEVVAHIKSKENEARLLIVDPATDEYFKKLGVTPAEEHIRGEGFHQEPASGKEQFLLVRKAVFLAPLLSCRLTLLNLNPQIYF